MTFNMTRKASDKNKPGGYNKWSILFNSIISLGEMLELPLVGRKYTWSNNHEDPTYALLDRVLVSPSWEEKFPLVHVEALTRELSDHTPLLISSGDIPRKPFIFKFENSWFQRQDLDEVVRRVWNKHYPGRSLLDIWQARIRALRKALKGWN